MEILTFYNTYVKINTMKQLLFVRHAESQVNVRPDLINGRMNHIELTEKGVKQARLLGNHLASSGAIPDVVYRSPAVRTQRTAEHAMAEMNLPQGFNVRVHDGLQEMSLGEYEGRARDEVYTRDILRNLARDGMDGKLPGTESMNDVGKRMFETSEKILDELDDNQSALIFGHGMAIRCLAAQVKGWNRSQTFRSVTHNTSRTQFTFDDGTLNLDYLGKHDHLSDEDL